MATTGGVGGDAGRSTNPRRTAQPSTSPAQSAQDSSAQSAGSGIPGPPQSPPDTAALLQALNLAVQALTTQHQQRPDAGHDTHQRGLSAKDLPKVDPFSGRDSDWRDFAIRLKSYLALLDDTLTNPMKHAEVSGECAGSSGPRVAQALQPSVPLVGRSGGG